MTFVVNIFFAVPAGLEPVTTDVTGRHSTNWTTILYLCLRWNRNTITSNNHCVLLLELLQHDCQRTGLTLRLCRQYTQLNRHIICCVGGNRTHGGVVAHRVNSPDRSTATATTQYFNSRCASSWSRTKDPRLWCYLLRYSATNWVKEAFVVILEGIDTAFDVVACGILTK